MSVPGFLREGDRYLDGGVFTVRLRRSAGIRWSELRLQTTEGVSAAQTKTKKKSKGTKTGKTL